MSSKTTDELLVEYRACAVQHGQATEEGQARRGDRAHDRLREIRRELDHRGAAHARRLMELLDDEDRSVRCWAASEALSFAPEEAVRVLREVASGPRGMVRLNAEMTLELWESGEWRAL